MQLLDCRVLVLKDEQVRNITKQMLVRMGVREDNIFLSSNIEEAKDIIISERFNLILAGIGINEEVGPVLLKWLQETGIRQLISFIFYSGGGEHYIKQKAVECGTDGYIPLPISAIEFSSKLKEVLSKK